MAGRKSSANEIKQVQAFKDRIIKEAEQIIHEVFPKKILELDQLLQSKEFSVQPEDVHADLNIPLPLPISSTSSSKTDTTGDGPPAKRHKVSDCVTAVNGTPVYCLPNGVVPSNQRLSDLVDIVKPLLKEMIEYTNKMKMWIVFLTPKIEDGNNFGVSVQEESLGEVRQIEVETASYLDQCTRYYISRGKMISKVAKYPHIEDYRKSVIEMDEKHLLNIKLTVAELRNSYSSLHDLIIKNLDKIEKPRASNAMHMY